MKIPVFLAAVLAAAVCAGPVGFAQNGDFSGHGKAVVTILPHNKTSEQRVQVSRQDVQAIKLNGQSAEATGLKPLQGANSPVELVFLIDSGARDSLGTQLGEISSFVKEMPPHTKMAIAYMQNGAAQFAQPFSSNPAQVLKALHVPAGPIGASASPYFCLSDLAKHWPSNNASARRIAIVISDGIDYYDLRYDPDDPYVHAAIDDAVRNRLLVYFLFWANEGRISRSGWQQSAGQNLMAEVTDATGGYSYWLGFGNPVSFQPYLQDVRRRLENQFELSFAGQNKDDSTQVERLDVKIEVPNAKVDAPKRVAVEPGGEQK